MMVVVSPNAEDGTYEHGIRVQAIGVLTPVPDYRPHNRSGHRSGALPSMLASKCSPNIVLHIRPELNYLFILFGVTCLELQS